MVDLRAATLADVDRIHALLDERSRAAFGESALTRHQVEADLQRVPGDRWVAVDGDVVGYAHLTSTHEVVVCAPDAHVADALLRCVDERARARGFDALEATVVPEDEPLSELVQRAGFSQEREVLRMWRVLGGAAAQPSWPEGTSVRSYSDDDGHRVHALLDDAYGGWDATYVRRPHDDWLSFMTCHDEFDPSLWFLVERGEDLVAVALHWKEHERRGWVKDIVVRPDERGRGLGTALLQQGFHAYATRAVERVGLKVDASNPTGAPQLYERMGFVTDRRYGIWRREL